MKFIYNNENYGLEFSYFENKGYKLFEIPQNDYTYLNEIESGDVLFIRLDDIDIINEKVNPTFKLTIFLFVKHEYCNRHRRKSILDNKNPNHKIFFITTHLDNDTIEYDLALRSKCIPFRAIFPKETLIISNDRSKKYNFFNRSINIRRLKVYELLKSTNLIDCYYTFGNIIKKNTFDNVSNIKEFLAYRSGPGGGRNNNDGIVLDIDLLEQSKDEFVLIENREDVENSRIQQDSNEETYYEINKLSADSYVSFIIESSGDSGDDLRITEKTIRSWLYKNIFLSLQCNGFNRALRNNGIQTFEDVFGLDENWDENKSETTRIETFVNALKCFNLLSIDEVKQIYNSDSVQKRLENNYKIVGGCFNPLNAIMEIDKLISYENNVH